MSTNDLDSIQQPEPARKGPRFHTRLYSALSTQHAALWLVLLTLVGGGLRFGFLEKPPIWYDEAATFGRVAGTYQQLLDTLEEAGFGPLHYHANWWIKNGLPTWGKIEPVEVSAFRMRDGVPSFRGTSRSQRTVIVNDLKPLHPIVKSGAVRMTPRMMRLIPALCGTLMIPAMFWLAMEFTGRRGAALLAATLTTFSAYLLNYSRDAKMYMDLWLCVTVSGASLLWWLRTRRALPWWCWVTSGTIALGLQALAAIPLAIEVLILLTAPRQRWGGIGMFIGYFFATLWRSIRERQIRIYWPWLKQSAGWTLLGLRGSPLPWFAIGVAVMLIGPYGYFHEFNKYAEQVDDSWVRSGLHWIDSYNAGRNGPSLLQYAGSAFLTGWEWPKVRDEAEVSPRVLWWLKTGCIGIACSLILGTIPWPALTHTIRRRPVVPNPYWRESMWLMLWIAVPVYALYVISVRNYTTPGDWIDALAQVWRGALWPKIVLPALALIAFYVSGRTWRERLIQSAKFIAVIVIVLICVWLVKYGIARSRAESKGSWRNQHSMWIPRYLGVILPALFVASAVLMLRLPTRILRGVAIALFVAVNLGQFGARVFAGSEPPVDLMVRDVIETKNNSGTLMFYSVRSPSMSAGLGPGTGVLGYPTSRYYWAVYTNTPADPEDVRNFMGSAPWGRMPSSVGSSVRSDSKIKRIVVWDSASPGKMQNSDRTLTTLGPDWVRTGEQIFFSREHWTWRNFAEIRRRTYERIDRAASTTAPSTLPAGN